MKAIHIIPLLLAVSALLLLTSTNVVTLFQGSHQIIEISGNGNNINCTSCHPQIADQLRRSAIHSNFKCEECHRLRQTAEGKTIVYAEHNASGIFAGNQSHAAYTPRCLDCHGGNGIYVNYTGETRKAPVAKAFNESNYGSDYSAHKQFVLDALNCNLSVGENEACIACHTNYSAKISYSYFYNIDYRLYYWNFTSFSYNGTRSYAVIFSKTGAKHEFLNTSRIDCTKCHKNIYDALVNGTSPTYRTHSPIAINSSVSTNNWNTDNAWKHYRYHYIPPASRATWVNNSYCFKCHNVNKYANDNPSASTTYDLSNVIADTNSTKIHCAESLWCATCHGSGKTKVVIDNTDRGGTGHSGTNFVDSVANNYARTFNGDICMGCHEAAVHPGSECGRCHSSSDATVYIESEPSGYATNT